MSKQMTNDQGSGPALLTAKEAGKKLRRTPKTLANWRSGNTGPAYIKVSPGRGGGVLYDAADVDRWIREHRIEAA